MVTEYGKSQLLGEGGDNLGYIWRREVKIPVIVSYINHWVLEYRFNIS